MEKRVLIIDDHYAIRKSFELAFLDTEFNLETAESGMAAIKILKNQKFDLIFLDMKMPDLNGIETFREIRKIDPDVFIYFITAFHQEYFTDMEQLIEEGESFELLQKPIDDSKIIMLSKAVLEN